jgi:hypothetical protein
MKKFLSDLFKDNNDINEKSVVGFISFLMMIITLIVDLISGIMGKELPIHQFIYEGFIYLALGSFGIASIDKLANRNNSKKNNEEELG